MCEPLDETDDGRLVTGDGGVLGDWPAHPEDGGRRTRGRARVRGIGEIVSDLSFKERTFTLLTPPIHASTPVVYRAWDSMGGPVGDNGNDLEPAALVAYPQLAEARDALWELSGVRPRLAGSGSTWFVDGAYPSARTIVTTSIRSQAV